MFYFSRIIRSYENIFSILCFTISRKVKTQLKCKTKTVQWMEEVLWLTECVKNGLWSFALEISGWMVLHDQVDQLKYWQRSNWVINWEQSMLYHVGDNWHTQNIQINKVTGKNKNFAFYGKKLNSLFDQSNI